MYRVVCERNGCISKMQWGPIAERKRHRPRGSGAIERYTAESVQCSASKTFKSSCVWGDLVKHIVLHLMQAAEIFKAMDDVISIEVGSFSDCFLFIAR